MAQARITAATSAIKALGIEASYRKNGDHFEASAGPAKSTYLSNEEAVAGFLETELSSFRSNPGSRKNRALTPGARKNKAAAKPAAVRGNTVTTNRQNPDKMANVQQEVKKAVRTLPNSVAIAGGAAASHVLTQYLANGVLAAQNATVRQLARVGVPLAAAQVVKKKGGKYGKSVATGMEVDAAVAAINIVASYVSALSFVTPYFSQPLGSGVPTAVAATEEAAGIAGPLDVPQLSAPADYYAAPPKRVIELDSV